MKNKLFLTQLNEKLKKNYVGRPPSAFEDFYFPSR